MDAQDQLEMAMLDKEMAEEKAEAAELELEELKEKLAVMQVEMNVLKGEEGVLDPYTMIQMLGLLTRVARWERSCRGSWKGLTGIHPAGKAKRALEGGSY